MLHRSRPRIPNCKRWIDRKILCSMTSSARGMVSFLESCFDNSALRITIKQPDVVTLITLAPSPTIASSRARRQRPILSQLPLSRSRTSGPPHAQCIAHVCMHAYIALPHWHKRANIPQTTTSASGLPPPVCTRRDPHAHVDSTQHVV